MVRIRYEAPVKSSPYDKPRPKPEPEDCGQPVSHELRLVLSHQGRDGLIPWSAARHARGGTGGWHLHTFAGPIRRELPQLAEHGGVVETLCVMLVLDRQHPHETHHFAWARQKAIESAARAAGVRADKVLERLQKARGCVAKNMASASPPERFKHEGRTYRRDGDTWIDCKSAMCAPTAIAAVLESEYRRLLRRM